VRRQRRGVVVVQQPCASSTCDRHAGEPKPLCQIPILPGEQLTVVAAVSSQHVAPKEAGSLDRVVALVAAALEIANAGEQALADARLGNDESARAVLIRRL